MILLTPPQPGRLRHTSQVEVRIGGAESNLAIALACSTLPNGFARWSQRLLADRLVELEISEAVSYQTIRRVLKKTNSDRG
jgi:hypothetical protein